MKDESGTIVEQCSLMMTTIVATNPIAASNQSSISSQINTKNFRKQKHIDISKSIGVISCVSSMETSFSNTNQSIIDSFETKSLKAEVPKNNLLSHSTKFSEPIHYQKLVQPVVEESTTVYEEMNSSSKFHSDFFKKRRLNISLLN